MIHNLKIAPDHIIHMGKMVFGEIVNVKTGEIAKAGGVSNAHD